MISLGREYEVIFVLSFFCLSFVFIVLAFWEKVKGRQKCAAEEMKREPLAKRAGAYWPINSPKCCCIPSIPHFVSKDLSYGFAIDFFCQIARQLFSSSAICYGNGETNIEEREKEGHKWSLNCGPLLNIPQMPEQTPNSMMTSTNLTWPYDCSILKSKCF